MIFSKKTAKQNKNNSHQQLIFFELISDLRSFFLFFLCGAKRSATPQKTDSDLRPQKKANAFAGRSGEDYRLRRKNRNEAVSCATWPNASESGPIGPLFLISALTSSFFYAILRAEVIMVRNGMFFAALFASFMFSGSLSFAQSVTAKGEKSASAEITLAGTVSSSIMISVNGSSNSSSSATTVVSGSGFAGTINFGVVGLPNTVVTGEKQEVLEIDGKAKGFYLVATVTASAIFTGFGGGSATIDIQRIVSCSSAPDVPCGALFFARPNTTGTSGLAWPVWTMPDPRFGSTVFEIPNPTQAPGAGNLASGVGSGEIVEHQLAVWIPADAPAGDFETTIKYTATHN